MVGGNWVVVDVSVWVGQCGVEVAIYSLITFWRDCENFCRELPITGRSITVTTPRAPQMTLTWLVLRSYRGFPQISLYRNGTINGPHDIFLIRLRPLARSLGRDGVACRKYGVL